MSHTKQNFEDGKVLSASQLNNIENSIITDEKISLNLYDYVMSIFENIVCIGDSLTAGFTNKCGTTYGSNTARPTKRNWPSYLGDRLNRTITNLGYGSTTTRSWRYANDGLGANITLATTLSDTDCYIIGLGFNDIGKNIPVGSISDIMPEDFNNNSDTFYGNYDFIVRSLLKVNSKLHIFLLTPPDPKPVDNKYSNAIRELSSTHGNNVHLIDLSKDYNEFYNSGIIKDTFNGHAFPLTYNIMSIIIQKAISNYMIKNYAKFYGTPWQ